MPKNTESRSRHTQDTEFAERMIYRLARELFEDAESGNLTACTLATCASLQAMLIVHLDR